MAVSTVDIYPSGPLIAMLGNPNAGKTSLFNILTGSKQKVANYAGVTVERVEGQLIGAPEKIRVLDLPGTYSFHPRSPDEKVTVDVLKGVARGERRPDLVVCVLDATNLRRGLKLVMAAQRLKLPAVVAVNMMDLARRRGIELKAEDLSRELGVPVVETIAVRKQGIDRLTELLSDPSAWSSWVPEATEEDDLARLNRILRKLGLDKIFPDEFSDRIDRVVLRYDATSRSTSLQVLQGAPSSEPAGPDLSRTEMVYDLCLAEVSRPAGQTSVSTANLTDTRADAALCGLMRDGVNGIPMEALGAQALAKAKETAELCDKLLASYTGGYLGIWPVTLPADGWAECTDVPGYAYKQTAQLRAAREANVPSAVPTPETFTVAVAAGLAGVCETKDGTITFWAEKVPEGGIQMQVELLGPSASTADTGEDTLGDTVLEDTTL